MKASRETVMMPDPSFPIRAWYHFAKSQPMHVAMHYHSEIELACVSSGTLWLRIGTRELSLEVGDVILISSSFPHSFSMDVDVEYYLTQFSPKLFYDFPDGPEYRYMAPFIDPFSCGYHIIKKNDLINFNEFMKNFLRNYNKKELGYELQVKADIYKMVADMYLHGLIRSKLPDRVLLSPDAQKQLRDVIVNIKQNYHQNFCIADLAESCGYDYHYFCRLFKKSTGKTVTEYINHIRINAAERLLLTTEQPISDIISQTGFSGFSYFNRVFKKIKGCTPSDCRRQKAYFNL